MIDILLRPGMRKFLTANSGMGIVFVIVLLSKFGLASDVAMAGIAGVVALAGMYNKANLDSKKAELAADAPVVDLEK